MEILRHVPPPIFEDKIYLECLRLAEQSKSDEERYGSELRKGDRTIGRGYNRAISHPSFKLKRIIHQGYHNHAEGEAINDGLERKHKIEGATIFVAGYFPKDNGLLFLHNEFTCRICVTLMKKYGIEALFVPTPEGWLFRSMEEAEIEAKKYSHETHEQRLKSVLGHWTVKDLKNL
jgi:hypothetical protein